MFHIAYLYTEEIFCVLSRKHKKFLHGYCFGWLWWSGLVVNIIIWTTWRIFEALGSSSVCLLKICKWQLAEYNIFENIFQVHGSSTVCLLRICKRQLAECELESVGGEHGCWLGQHKNTKEYVHKLGLLGTGGCTKTDEFSEKFQTAFDAPLIFGKSCCNFSEKPCLKVQNAIRIFGLKMTPLSWNFSENSSFLVALLVP